MGAQGAGPDRDRATSKACWFVCLLEYLPSVNPNYVVIFGARSDAGSCKDMPFLEKKFQAVLAICYKCCACVLSNGQMERAAGVMLRWAS